MAELSTTRFDPDTFLASPGLGRRVVHIKTNQTFFVQGDQADSVFYVQSGRAKLTVVSTHGKEATLTMIATGHFAGAESLIGADRVRRATATALTPCMALKIDRDEMKRVLHDEQALSDIFVKFLVDQSIRAQADLVDQLFNSSERRLARILLMMSDFGTSGETHTLIPPITQESLAGMVGTTRSRVSFFMNRFRKLGLIEYNGRIHVHRTLLDLFLHDQTPGEKAGSKQFMPIPPMRPEAQAQSFAGHEQG